MRAAGLLARQLALSFASASAMFIASMRRTCVGAVDAFCVCLGHEVTAREIIQDDNNNFDILYPHGIDRSWFKASASAGYSNTCETSFKSSRLASVQYGARESRSVMARQGVRLGNVSAGPIWAFRIRPHFHLHTRGGSALGIG